MKIHRIAMSVVFLAAAVAAGSGVGAANAAPTAAWPEDCKYYPSDNESGYAFCATGGGSYRVVINCGNKYTGAATFYYGATWKRPGQWSIRTCPNVGDSLRFVGIDTKAS